MTMLNSDDIRVRYYMPTRSEPAGIGAIGETKLTQFGKYWFVQIVPCQENLASQLRNQYDFSAITATNGTGYSRRNFYYLK